MRGRSAASLPPRARSAPLAPLRGHAALRCTPRAGRVRRPRRCLPHACRGHSGPPWPVAPVEGVAGAQRARPSLSGGALHPLPAHRALGRHRARRGQAPRRAPLGHGWPTPLVGPAPGALPQRPQPPSRLGLGQAGGHPPPRHLAQPAVLLARGSRVVRAGRRSRPGVHEPRAALGHGGRRPERGLPLVADPWARPRRRGQAGWPGVAGISGQVPRHGGQGPGAIPGPRPAPSGVSAPARGARAGLETGATPPPARVAACAQGAQRCRRESPAPPGVPRPLHAGHGLGGCASRWPLPASLAAPQQWPPAAAGRQGQRVPRFQGRCLRTVSAHARSSQRLLGASAQASLLSRT
jgi:hypothetical protein